MFCTKIHLYCPTTTTTTSIILYIVCVMSPFTNCSSYQTAQCGFVFVGFESTACSEKSGQSMNSNSSAFGGGPGDHSSLSTLSEDFPAELIHELEAATGANGNDEMREKEKLIFDRRRRIERIEKF